VRVLFDTNVILDVLLARDPHAQAAARLLAILDRRKLAGLLCSTTVTTIYYVVAKAVGGSRAREHIRGLLARFEVAPVDHAILSGAIEMRTVDYEDAVLHEAARAAGATCIVTRNPKHFGRSSLQVLAPQDLLSALLTPGS
jgi:predicted nucleic acid-binding protein